MLTSNSNIVLGQILPLTEKLLDAHGQPQHRYFHTNFSYTSPPYTKLPIYLEGYNARKKTFQLRVLTEQRDYEVKLNYPLIPITEEQAQAIIDQRIGTKKKGAPSKPKPMSTSATPSEEAKPDEAKPKSKERVQRNGRTSMSSLILDGLVAGTSQDDLLASLKQLYSEHDEKKIRSLISTYRSRLKFWREHPEHADSVKMKRYILPAS